MSELLNGIYDDFYKEHPFTFRSEEPIDLKQVVNTNKCFLHLAKYENKLHQDKPLACTVFRPILT